jgi:hypothetical protein
MGDPGDRLSALLQMPRGPAVRQGDGLRRADTSRRPGARQDLAMDDPSGGLSASWQMPSGPAVRQGDGVLGWGFSRLGLSLTRRPGARRDLAMGDPSGGLFGLVADAERPCRSSRRHGGAAGFQPCGRCRETPPCARATILTLSDISARDDAERTEDVASRKVSDALARHDPAS